jgi:DNA gyrase subunit A
MGRTAAGVNAIKLEADDFVTSMEVVDPEADLLVVTEKGFGKRTPLSEYAAKSRAIGGVATIAQKNLETTGRVASARVVCTEDEITIMTTNGQTLRLRVTDIRQSSRSTMGTHLINLKEGDTVASVARLAAKDLAMPAEEKKEAKAGPAEAAAPVEPAEAPDSAEPAEAAEAVPAADTGKSDTGAAGQNADGGG